MSSIYEEWQIAKRNLDEAKAEELRLRNAICEAHLEGKLEGSHTDYYENLKITCTARLNRSIDRATLDSIWPDLSTEEQDAIEFKPSLVLAKYRPFEEGGSILTEAITVKPGQSSLKIEEVPDEQI